MPSHVCPQCGTAFYHRKSARTFCGLSCYHAHERANPNSGTRQMGEVPHNKLPVGSVRIRQRRNRSEGPRAWVKVAEPNVWRLRAVLEWEKAHGVLAPGLVVHHVNRDTLDDRIENLEAIDRASHLLEHRHEFEPRRARRASAARWSQR
jgi:hypothetical protein